MDKRKETKKSKSALAFIMVLILLAAVFAVLTSTIAKRTFENAKAVETFTEVDYYSMQKYCSDNSAAVMNALKSGSKSKIEALMADTSGIDDVLEFADWSNADFKNAIGLGAGSLSPAPDADGRMDMSERFFVDVDDVRYVLFIESVTSRWGRNDEGVSAVAVTTYDYFDSVDYNWCGEKSDNSALTGSLFWDKSDLEEQDDTQE